MSKGLPFIPHDTTENIIHISLSNNLTLKMKTSDIDTLQTGGSIWHAGFALANFLCLNPDIVLGKRVLEIGSGCGLLGITAASLGAKEVVLTDLAEQQIILKENIDLNRYLWSSSCNCQAEILLFGDKVTGDFDVLIGSDIGYDNSLHAPIAETLKSFCSRQMFNKQSEADEIINKFKILLVEEVRWNDIFEWYKETLNEYLSSLEVIKYPNDMIVNVFKEDDLSTLASGDALKNDQSRVKPNSTASPVRLLTITRYQRADREALI